MGMAAVALLIVERRIVGAAVNPLPPQLLLAVVSLAAAAAAGIRRLAQLAVAGPAWHARVVEWVPRAALALLIIALWIPGTSAGAAVLAVCVVLLEEGLTEVFQVGGKPRRRRATMPPKRETPARLPGDDAKPLANDRLSVPRSDDESIEQTLQRRQTADGGTLLSGQICTSFEPGQRTAWAHVAFCPPFERVPRLEFQQSGGPEVRTKIGSLLPYGVRFELKQIRPSVRAERVTIEFVATGQRTSPNVTPEVA